MACADQKLDPKAVDCCHRDEGPQPGLRFYERLVGRVAYIMAPYAHDSGEYFILAQDLYRIDCVKLIRGYDGYSIKRFVTEPQVKYDDNGKKSVEQAAVLSNVRFDPALVTRWCVEQYAWAKKPLAPGEKRQWVESVYTGAANMAELVASQLDLEIINRQRIAKEIYQRMDREFRERCK